MKRRFLFSLLMLVALSAKSQYYYDRSKYPDRTIKATTEEKPSQDFGKYYYIALDYNTPLSNTDFISKPNAGFKVGFRKRLNDIDRLWTGVDFGYTVYHQYFPYQTSQVTQTQSISTDFYHYTYSYSLTGNINYFFVPMEKILVPYGGLGIGIAANKFAQYYNIFGDAITAWGVQLRPEVGILVGWKTNSPWRLQAGAHYDYASSKSTTYGFNNYLNYGVQVGIVKMVR